MKKITTKQQCSAHMSIMLQLFIFIEKHLSDTFLKNFMDFKWCFLCICVMQSQKINAYCFSLILHNSFIIYSNLNVLQWKKVYMLAVGTGIAPMSQVIQTVLNNSNDETVMHLLYGCKRYQDILMKGEIQEWSRYWNFSCQYHLSQVDTYMKENHSSLELIGYGLI